VQERDSTFGDMAVRNASQPGASTEIERSWEDTFVDGAPRASFAASTFMPEPLPPQAERATESLVAVGEVVGGSYEIQGLLGRGGMAHVYEATDSLLGRRVAIKVADPRLAPWAAEQIRREGLALAALRHPGLVAIYAAGEHRRMPFLALERIYGKSLEDHLRQSNLAGEPFTLTETLDVLIGLVEALSVLHHAGIVHRDVKPANVMLAPRGRTVLMDLGIFVAESERSDGQAVGTPHYMAPEAIRSSIEPGLAHLADLYSIGVLAFTMLSGFLPFDGVEVTDILCQHLDSPVPDLARARGGIPRRLSSLVGSLMAKDPRERPPHADDVLWQLVQLRRREPEPRRAMSVLIVDDDPDARRILKACVERTLVRAEVSMAGSAEQALRHIHRDPPDFILLDLRLPGMNGLELYLILSGMRLLERTDVVVVSGETDAVDLETLRNVGAARFLLKGPGLPHELARILREAAMRRAGAASV
jgi:eukaryotic-like serine/threonine-protein kinase